MTQIPDKPSIDDTMEHYGVLGMHWGATKAKASGSQVRSSRSRMSNKSDKITYQKNILSRTTKGSSARVKEKKRLSSMKIDYLNNPDRVTAARMTQGEKTVALLFVTPVLAGAAIAVTSARSRRIDYKQRSGAYNKPSAFARNSKTGVRPIAAKLDSSKFGQVANENAQKYMAKQNAKAAKR